MKKPIPKVEWILFTAIKTYYPSFLGLSGCEMKYSTEHFNILLP